MIKSMSTTRNFRIAVNLSNFFHDHRNRARIFINNDIQTIRDLEKRIEKIFHIKNFHLTSQNEFLPPTEDVRILQQDDIIWVVPNMDQQPIVSNITSTEANNVPNQKRSMSLTGECIEQLTHPPKKKKKAVYDLEKNKEETNIVISSKERCKKRKKHKDKECRNIIDEVNVTVEASVETEPSIHKSKKKKKKVSDDSAISDMSASSAQNESSALKINSLLPILQDHINSYNKQLNKLNNSETSSSTLETSTKAEQYDYEINKDTKETYKCKGNLSSYKKKISIPTITDKYLQEKKVNIVKIEYLAGRPAQTEQELTKGDTLHKYAHNNDFSDQSSKITNNIQNLMEYENDGKDYISYDALKVNETTENTDTHEYPIKLTPNKDEKVNHDRTLLKFKCDSLSIPNNDANITTSITNVNDQIDESNTKRYTSETVANQDNNKSSYETPAEHKNSIEIISPIPEPVEPLVTNKTNVINDMNYNTKNCSKSMDIDINKHDLTTQVPKPQRSSLLKTESRDNSFAKRELTPLQNNTQNEANTQMFETTANENTNIPESNNLTINTDILNENVSFQSETVLIDSAIMDEASLNDTKKYSDVHKDVTATLDRLSDSATSDLRPTSSFMRRKRLSGIGQLLGELRNNESLVTGESMDSDPTEEFVTKRRRRRVRRRRKKNNETTSNTSITDSSDVTPKCVPKPLKIKACPTMHLKFEEEGDILKTVDVTENKCQQGEVNKSYVETSIIETVTIESDVEESNSQNFNIKEDLILKSPSIRNSFPRIGDIIAFKILRITDNYTPEVSSYIIGKVLEYNSDSKTVIYEILNGLHQCEEPKGRLTIGSEENVIEKKSNKREFSWTDVIDPRLIFP